MRGTAPSAASPKVQPKYFKIMKEFINVLEDSYPLYEYCKENGFTELDYEDWYNNGGELGFFDGDPDMIKVNGEIGYFCECGDKVFYYFDDCFEYNAEMILIAFFGAYRTGITLGGESWVSGYDPDEVETIENGWNGWDVTETGIAYRGGAGYCYWLTDWSKWLESNKVKAV